MARGLDRWKRGGELLLELRLIGKRGERKLRLGRKPRCSRRFTVRTMKSEREKARRERTIVRHHAAVLADREGAFEWRDRIRAGGRPCLSHHHEKPHELRIV